MPACALTPALQIQVARLLNQKTVFRPHLLSNNVNPTCHNGPKFLETCFEVLETSSQAKLCTNFPKICTNFLKICTNFPKIFQKNSVMRCLNNFRIYGSPPSPGVYNDTHSYDIILLIDLSLSSTSRAKVTCVCECYCFCCYLKEAYSCDAQVSFFISSTTWEHFSVQIVLYR